MRYKHPIFQPEERESGRASNGLTLSLFVLCTLALLGGYIAWLQLFKSRELGEWALRQQDSITIIPGRRGSILDRNGVPLNKSVPSYSMALRIEQLRDPRDTQRRTLDKVCMAVSELAAFLGPQYYHSRPTRQEARTHIQKNTSLPFVLWKDLDRATMERWAAAREQFPGSELVMSWKRHYEHPHAASIMRGSTGYDAPVYLPEFKHYNLSWLDLPGKSGLEAALNSKLSGTAGYEQVRLDVLAYRQEVIQSSPAQDGDDVTLTIDIALQQELEALLRSQHQAGAVVVMDLATSEVLAAVSEPSHPLGSESTPVQGSLLNRVLGGFYPPGSTLKPLVAIEALQLGLVTPEETINCPGYFRLPDGRQVACNKRSGHGSLSLEAALAHSCNVYFCVLGDRLGDHFERVGEAVGLGALPGSELRQQEKNGIRFVPSWVRQTGRPRWTAGDSANASIGQGSWIVTPMQLLIALSAIVTGRRHQPTFIQGAYLQPAEKTDWDEEMLAQIRKGMLGCTEYGTGKSMRIPGHAVLAKTGTAEVGGAQKPHALAFAAVPAEAPRFACVCVIEHGGGGGKVAGPIVQKALLAAMARQ